MTILKRSNAYNAEVEVLQDNLDVMGYSVTVDGYFGKATEKAVKEFQSDNNLVADGIVGKATFSKIEEIINATTVVHSFQLVNTEIPHHFEACKLTAYYCPANVLTIGWGSTGSHVYEGMTITQQEADELFVKDQKRFVDAVNNLVKVPLTQNQFDSLVSFVYNIGGGDFKSSTLLRKLNYGDYAGAADELLRWNRGGGKVLAGLTRRRKSERHYFLTGEINFFL